MYKEHSINVGDKSNIIFSEFFSIDENFARFGIGLKQKSF